MRNTSLLLAGLAAGAAAQDFNALELEWSYGRSPAVPAPIANGTGAWAAAYTKARALVGQMTNLEKNNITYGVSQTSNGCSGTSGSVPRLGFPGFCLQDAGNGVRGTDLVNSYASGIHVGATWNKDLAYQRAQYMGGEFRAKGVNVALGPVVGPLGRIAEMGRNFEGFSNDPYLCGSLAAQTVVGIQESVISVVKHFIGYEQETARNPSSLTNITSISSNMDDVTVHEVYLWPFQDAVHAGAAGIMPSYNKLNGSYASQNSKTLNGLLKTELGFQGFACSDWYGQHTGIASSNSGLDMAMPSSPYWMNGTLAAAVANGTVAQSRLNDMATRIIAAWYLTNEDSSMFPPIGMAYDLTVPHKMVDARDPASKTLRVQQAIEGHVLVKNVNNALPLKSPKFLSLFGYDAYAPLVEDPGNAVTGNSRFTLGGESTNINQNTWTNLFAVGNITALPESARNGTLFCGGGSGANTPAYISAPYDAFSEQAYTDGTFLFWDFESQNPIVDPNSEACIVFINEFASEGADRPGLADPWSDVLVENVANNCSNTMVVIHNAGVRLVNNWIAHPNITAVIYAHLPGQDSGRSLVQIMYGMQSPSGRLPYTVAKSESDYGNLLAPTIPPPDVTNPEHYYPQSNFTEGVYIDYKAFIRSNILPQFEFGFGLTYTNFTYADLSMALTPGAVITVAPPTAATVEGGNPHLWDVLATVTASVQNSGSVEAADVSQLYIGIPGGPAKQLRGYQKSMLAPGASKNLRFDLTRRDLSAWDVVSQQWLLQAGTYMVYVGESVLDIRLTGNLTVMGNSLGA